MVLHQGSLQPTKVTIVTPPRPDHRGQKRTPKVKEHSGCSSAVSLHAASLPPPQVTVLIYTDLILLTREDEAGRCNVLQSPLYLHNTRLHYGT